MPPGAAEAAGGAQPARTCGGCSLCCVVLRVDELGKLGGTPCRHLGPPGSGCSIHPRRPGICRRYQCLWLRGWFEPEDRPDALGAVLDLDASGGALRLAVRLASKDGLERSPRLRALVERMRETLPVRITDTDDVLNPDRPYRVLLAGGEEHRVTGDVTVVARPGEPLVSRRAPWLERTLRRLVLRREQRRLRRFGGA
jgi:hypothetical protein